MKKVIGHSNTKSNHWLMSKYTDLLVLLLPVWLVWCVFFSNAGYFQNASLPPWAWLIFIVGLDVSHVWSSLFRTYLNKEEFEAQKTVLIITPIVVFVMSFAALAYSTGLFWRIMAYIAVFHFIKQQYGFTALYQLKTGSLPVKKRLSDKFIIYLLTLYPIVYWHFNSTSEFNWFVENDFFRLYEYVSSPEVILSVFNILNWFYWIVLMLWIIQEIGLIVQSQSSSIGKILWVITTAVNWWFAIVYFNSDLIFSISNVVAHGIPYIALIYYYNLKKKEYKTQVAAGLGWKLKWALILVATILFAAITEEYFWDMFIYDENRQIFESIAPYNWNQLTDKWAVIFAMAILALPQLVHYVIDGFIWKMNSKNKYLKPIFGKPDES